MHSDYYACGGLNMKKKLIALLTACMFALCTVTSALALDKVSLPATSTATAAPAQSKRIEKKCGTSKSMVTSLLSSKSGGSGLHAAPSAISSYNEHDVALMRAFLEITDSKGVKNGQKINNYSDVDYDADDPSTWANIDWTEDGELAYIRFWSVNFTEYTINPVTGMEYPASGEMLLVGDLDLSGCQSLVDINVPQNNLTSVRADNCPSLEIFYAGEQADFAGADMADRLFVYASADNCPNLYYIGAPNNDLEHFSFKNAPALVEVMVDSTPRLAEVNIDESPVLEAFSANETAITSIDLSGRSSLIVVHADYCPIERVNLSDCTADFELSVAFTHTLTELDLSDCTGLNALYVDDTSVSRLNFDACSNLRAVSVGNSPLDEIDLTNCPSIYWCNTQGNNDTLHRIKLAVGEHILIISAENGTVGLSFAFFSVYDESYDQSNDFLQVYCSSSNGNDFIGWENQSGELVSTETEFALSPEYIASIHETDFTLTAKYAASFLSGDANGDGAVNTEDAVLIMRAALELQPEISVEVCDMNSNGIIDIADAIIVMRSVLGV